MKWAKWIIIKNTIVLKALVSRHTAQKMKFCIKDFFSKCDMNTPECYPNHKKNLKT